jgi:hypothetical protein
MASAYESELAKKLNLKSGMKVHVIGGPAEVDAKADPVLAAARADRIAWLAYPKGGKRGTDLNRDILWNHMLGKGVQGVRQVAIDETWSALRFRPAR